MADGSTPPGPDPYASMQSEDGALFLVDAYRDLYGRVGVAPIPVATGLVRASIMLLGLHVGVAEASAVCAELIGEVRTLARRRQQAGG